MKDEQKQDENTEFVELFWKARKEHVKLLKEASAKGRMHKVALAFAIKHKMKWGELLLDASLRSKQGKGEDALKELVAKWNGIPSSQRGFAYFVKGAVLQDLDRADDAVNAYRKAVADRKFDTPGRAWNNMGQAYGEKGEYDKSIKAFRKALAEPKYDKPGNVWYNMGIAYRNKGEHDEAIKAYRKALVDPKFDTPGRAWNNLGNAYGGKGEYDEAIKAYRKALKDPKYDAPGRALANWGLTYQKLGKNEQALEVLKEALEKSEKRSEDYSRAQRLLSLVEADLKPEAMSSDDRSSLERPAMTDKEGPEQRLLGKIEGKQESEYDKYLEEKDSGRDDTLSILRGWSSAVTLLEGSKQLWRGGGYFIKWRGKGIVIDPGFDFLRNFHDAKYHGREIDAVLITHNHTDHNADIRAIDDLRYELYKRRGKYADGKIEPYLLMWDKDSEKSIKLPIDKPEHRFKRITFDAGLCEPTHNSGKRHNLPFTVDYFPVEHDEGVIEDPVGFKVVLKDGRKNALSIGFTGDTEYFDELGKHLSGCDVLVGHISQPDKAEFTDPKHRKKNHLGYNGLVELIKVAKPKLTLVGEFWAGIEDVRIDLVQCLRERTRRREIFPAGIGLNVFLPSLEIECTKCEQRIPFAKVCVGAPTEDCGNLSYLCEHCRLD